ncbi:unnamed protein product [Lactuca virosa]|uniref:Uncharacterized protein n=1 Tax=Lactuca virosa TaxID=75947 RepID=A0AAU9M9R6_9ASTR|nr:unnamed protein product [Lactuca virosa]
MAQNKPSGFRFRLPWLLQPALATPPATAPEPPRTTVQTAVASTSAPKPPFRPAGRAPPRATPQSTSSPVSVTSTPLPPSQPVSVAPPPPPPPPPPPSPPPVEVKSPVANSPIAKVIEPVATRSTKETQTTSSTPTARTIETTGPATPPQKPPSVRPPSPPQPSSPAKPGSQPSSPSRTGTKFRDSSPPVSPSRMPASPPRADSKPLSPSRLATQPHVRSKPSSPSGEPPQTRAISQPTSPVNVQKPPSPPLSPSRLATQPHVRSKPSSPSGEPPQTGAISQPTSPVHVQPPPSPPPPPPVTPTITRRTAVQEVSVNHDAQPPLSTSKPDDTKEIKKFTEITNENFPVDSYHVHGADAKPIEMTEVKGAQTKSMNNLHSMEAISPKQKQKVAAHVPLHREIKDDITKFIHKMATSHPKQSMDEKPASVITLAGDNKGASMHLGSHAKKKEGAIDIQRGYKLDAIINGEGSSKGKKSARESKASEDEEMKAIVNSNIQGINNSIMFNSYVTERNPGVHLAFSRTLAKTDSNIEKAEPMEMYKAEADITPPETLVYDPTTGRSLGGFFLEPTDSEPDDLEMFAGNYEIEVL